MRWSKLWVAASLLVALPVLTAAQDDPSIDELESSGGTTTVDGVDFDVGDNVLGNPENGGTVSSGTVESLTFLSGSADPLTIAVNIINVSLSFLGVISFILMAYAGFKWFTARDNEEEVTKAKDILKGTVIGLAISLSALGIAQLIFTGVVQRTTVQTSWLERVVPPAYAQDEEVPTYEAEELPFDPFEGSASGNTTLGDEGVDGMGSITKLDLGTADPLTIVVATVNGLITLLGIIFMIMLIYAGVLWVTARGGEEQITKAKTILIRSVVGLTIVLGSYGLARLVFFAIDFSTYGINLVE